MADESHRMATLENLNAQRQLNILCDILLVVETDELPAHKGVLAANSNYFLAMFTTDMAERQKETVKVNGVKAETMRALLDFMYTGHIKIHDGNVRELLQASNYLLVVRVKESCCRFLEDSIRVENCLWVLSIADEFSCDELSSRATNVLLRDFLQVAQTQEFLGFPVEIMRQLYASNEISVDCEDQLLDSLMEWISYDLKGRECFLEEMLKLIRWKHVKSSELRRLTNSSVLLSRCSRPRKSYSVLDVIVVAGGCDNSRILDSTACYVPSADKWCRLADMNVPRWRLTMGKTKNALFALGGLFEVSTTEPKIPFIEKYDGDHNTWSPVPHDIPFPEGLDFFATVAVEGSLFLIGGFDHVVRRPISSVLALNVDTDSPHYVEAASMSVPRFGHSVVTSQSHVYALGGSSGASMTSVQSMSSVERYDVTQDTWTAIPSMNQSRCFAAAVSIDDKIYVFGGCHEETVLRTAEMYDRALNQWRPISPMRTPRMRAGVALFHGKVYLFGGMADPWGAPLRSVQRYDPAEDRWAQLSEMPCARFDHHCCIDSVRYRNVARSLDDIE